MAVNVRARRLPSGGTHWQADIRVRLANGLVHRERVKAPGRTRAQALRWAQDREAHILRYGLEPETSDVPTLAEFAPRFLQDHVEANRLSPSTRKSYAVTIHNHLIPAFGDLALDKIGAAQIQALKRRPLSAATTNKILKHLRAILRVAVKWGVLEGAVHVGKVKQPERHPRFYSFEEYRRLVGAASTLDAETRALIRLGGDAGLRIGEILALRWGNVHPERHKLLVCENLVRGEGKPARWVVRSPKGGRPRWLPMTEPLERALAELPRRGETVLTRDSGEHIPISTLIRRLYRAQDRAGLVRCGPHILRHTFCSHLVLRGIHVRTIQKLAGHAKLTTTETYMHLVSDVEEDAIRRLRGGPPAASPSPPPLEGEPTKKESSAAG